MHKEAQLIEFIKSSEDEAEKMSEGFSAISCSCLSNALVLEITGAVFHSHIAVPPECCDSAVRRFPHGTTRTIGLAFPVGRKAIMLLVVSYHSTLSCADVDLHWDLDLPNTPDNQHPTTNSRLANKRWPIGVSISGP